MKKTTEKSSSTKKTSAKGTAKKATKTSAKSSSKETSYNLNEFFEEIFSTEAKNAMVANYVVDCLVKKGTAKTDAKKFVQNTFSFKVGKISVDIK